ncbi:MULTISPECIES: recombinase family protein [Thalassospira]|uniref:recombinase family protein n=1 Tax=Thalassospira TaxID=168934 RepID=UPI000C5ECD05|nr:MULTISPECIES: recombinase family protein [Thalassospira]MAB31474.1 DNA invertase [Thalassospira sp.]MAZ35002.1 DNA invertase [Thalassospira sp.]MBA05592.1 DNA invertase [Thalassospira sp.]MBR9817232.1 recombinase family protein [Rhodospirillales bacterium]|tara:strand:+ start:1092 stop:2000 length:909 start_codon:yes stop_codon:yes gene_type:complete
MAKIGYARVSTQEQSIEGQIDMLVEAGCTKIFQEKVSGIRWDRPELDKALAALKSGDEFVVYKLDRLGRSVLDLLNLIFKLTDEGKHFVSLSDAIDTSSPQGKFTLHMLGAVAEFERSLIVQRTRVGLAKARKAGRIGGNPKLKARDPESLRLLSERLKINYFEKINKSARIWLPIVRKHRPSKKWSIVTKMVNVEQKKQNEELWTEKRLKRAVKHFIKEGMLDAAVLERAPREEGEGPSGATLLVAGLVSAKPNITLLELKKHLDASSMSPKRSRDGWALSSVRQEVMKALDAGLLVRWKA